MERHQLEDRIRASLQARAEDVAPTPELWERVSQRTTRRARWTLGLWALSGVAAVVLVVFGGMALLDNPRNIEIQPEPDVVAPPDPGPVPVDPSTPTVVTTDGERLFEIDPATGEVMREMAPYEGFAEGGAAAEVAVRPLDEPGQLTVATVVERETVFDIEITVFDAAGERIDREPIGMAVPATELPPDIVWSADGRYLMWAGTSFVGSEASGPSLWAYDWRERPVTDDGEAEPFPVTAPGADGDLFTDDGTVDLRTWTGTPVGRSTVLATTATGGAFRIDLAGSRSDCAGNEPCPPTFEADVVDLGFEGMSPMDLGTLANGVNLALVVPTAGQGGPDGDAENATLQLVAEPMSDVQRVLDVPQLTAGTAAPPDAWMAAAGDRVAVGMGPEVHLLTVTGDTVEELEVTDAVTLPGGTLAADMATHAEPGEAPEDADAPTSPSTDPIGRAEEVPGGMAADGAPSHVVTADPDAGTLALVDRGSPGEPLATWARPDGVEAEHRLERVVVHPDSTPDRLQLVSLWVAGESQVLVRTAVNGGEVVANAPFDAEGQPADPGGAADATPVFSPSGDHLAWVETRPGTDTPGHVRIATWDDSVGATGPTRIVEAPADLPQPQRLVDWIAPADGRPVLTVVPRMPQSAGPYPLLLELRLDGPTSDPVAESTADDWDVLELPGPPVAAGSFPMGALTQRYVVFDDGGLHYGLAETPETAVELGLREPAAGRIVAFGPDSLVVQRATDDSWARIQVDDGATSDIEAPDSTMAFLPWPTTG